MVAQRACTDCYATCCLPRRAATLTRAHDLPLHYCNALLRLVQAFPTTGMAFGLLVLLNGPPPHPTPPPPPTTFPPPHTPPHIGRCYLGLVLPYLPFRLLRRTAAGCRFGCSLHCRLDAAHRAWLVTFAFYTSSLCCLTLPFFFFHYRHCITP